MKQGIAFRIIVLTCWILGILAPLYTFSRVYPSSRTAFDRVFQTQSSHVLMHTFLYAVLAYLVASVFFRSVSSAKQLFIFVVITAALVAVLQEVIQMKSEDIGLGFDEIFDFFVDLSGALIGTGLYFKFHRDRGILLVDEKEAR